MLLSLIAILAVGGSTAAYSVVIGRWFGPAVLGHASVALAIGLGGAQLATAGLSPAITRFVAHRLAGRDVEGARRVLVRGLVAVGVVGMTLGLAVAITGPHWTARIGLPAELVAPSAWLLALQCGYIGLKAALYGVGRVKSYARMEIAAGIGFAGGLAALLAAVPVGLVAPFIWANGVFVGMATAALALRQDEVPPTVSTVPPSSTGPIPFTLIATAGSAAALARLQLPVVVTAAWWQADEVGRLGAAMAFFPLAMLVPRAIELALLPALSTAWGRGDARELRAVLGRTTRTSLLVVGTVAFVLYVLGPAIIAALYGPAYAAAATAMRLVVLAAAVQGLAVPAVAALSAADGVAAPNAAGIAGLVASVIVWAVWVPEEGAIGAVAGLAVGSAVNAAIPMVVAWRRFGRGGGG